MALVLVKKAGEVDPSVQDYATRCTVIRILSMRPSNC